MAATCPNLFTGASPRWPCAFPCSTIISDCVDADAFEEEQVIDRFVERGGAMYRRSAAEIVREFAKSLLGDADGKFRALDEDPRAGVVKEVDHVVVVVVI